jgi:NADPH:quinone reductase
MKAIQFSRFGGPEVLEYVEIACPVPQGDEVLIEVTAAGVNFPDIRERMGVYQRAETQVGGVTLPHVTGLQVVGRVTQVGPRGDRNLVGKKVVSLLQGKGGYAQFVCASVNTTIVLPENADDILIASLPCQGVTAYLTLTASTTVKPGESVLVHGGAGGVGSLAIQIAKLLGAGQVIATAGSDEKRAFTLSLGADVAIDYGQRDWPSVVLDHTAGQGVDIILESIGGEVFEQNFECLATFGRHIIFGSTRGPGEPFAPRRLMTRAQSVTGLYMPVFFQKPALMREALSFLVDHALDGTLRAPATTVLPLGQAADAHRMLEDRRVMGFILLDPRK